MPVSKQSKAVQQMSADWTLARALLGGTRAMRDAGETYLPKWPNEDKEAYECRKATAVLFPAYQRTVSTLTGKPFSKSITQNDIPKNIVEWLDDCDLEGRNLDAFAADVMECALGMGVCGILVDCPSSVAVEKTEAGVATKAAEAKAGIRPYFIHIKPEQILGWIAKRENGAWILLQLRIMETVEEAATYGSVEVSQIRVLTPGAWETHRQNDKKEWVLYQQGVTTLKIIPFVPVYGQRTGFMIGRPPLIEVAHMNVAHWQSASDQQTILHVARVPILTVTGVNEDDKFALTIGGSAAVKLPLNATMEWVEHTGAAIEAGAKDIDSLEERMRQAGAELLVIAPGKVTATQIATENAVGMCALQRITLGLQDALKQAIYLMGAWMGVEQTGSVSLFNDFGAASLAEASAELLLKMNQAGKLSNDTLISEYKRRDILSASVTPEDEVEKIAGQGPVLSDIGTGDVGNG